MKASLIKPSPHIRSSRSKPPNNIPFWFPGLVKDEDLNSTKASTPVTPLEELITDTIKNPQVVPVKPTIKPKKLADSFEEEMSRLGDLGKSILNSNPVKTSFDVSNTFSMPHNSSFFKRRVRSVSPPRPDGINFTKIKAVNIRGPVKVKKERKRRNAQGTNMYNAYGLPSRHYPKQTKNSCAKPNCMGEFVSSPIDYDDFLHDSSDEDWEKLMEFGELEDIGSLLNKGYRNLNQFV
jgi:hypothetical protein